MVYPDDPVKGITGISPLSGRSGKSEQERPATRPLPRRAGKDNVDISPRARRLADIENFLSEGEKDESSLLKSEE